MTKIITKDLNYYKKLDKKVEMIPLTSDYAFKSIFTVKINLLKKFLLSALDLERIGEDAKIVISNNELPKQNNKEYQKKIDIYVTLNDKLHLDIELNKSYFKKVKVRNFLYATKIYSLLLEKNNNPKELEDNYFVQLNLNAKEKNPKIGDDIIVPYSIKSNEVFLDTCYIVLKYLEYYRDLYYNKGARDEETVWLTAFTAKTFTELYKILSHILDEKELIEFMNEVENMSLDDFSIHEWQKEKLDAYEKYKEKEEGIAEGEKTKALEIAKNMLKEKISIDIISKTTGLSIDEIKSLQTEE